MVKDTISGVPLTGRLKPTRPMTSAQTRKQSRKASVAATTSSTCAMRSLIFSITGGARRFRLLDLVTHRPLVAELLGFLERELQHPGRRQASLVELGRLLLRPA